MRICICRNLLISEFPFQIRVQEYRLTISTDNTPLS